MGRVSARRGSVRRGSVGGVCSEYSEGGCREM